MVGVAQIILENPWALLLLLLAWLVFVIFAWRRRFRPFGAFLLRLAILVLVTGALTRPVFLPPEVQSAQPEERLVLLVDQSASLGEAGQAALREEAAKRLEQGGRKAKGAAPAGWLTPFTMYHFNAIMAVIVVIIFKELKSIFMPLCLALLLYFFFNGVVKRLLKLRVPKFFVLFFSCLYSFQPALNIPGFCHLFLP